jgi:hypothetical protein
MSAAGGCGSGGGGGGVGSKRPRDGDDKNCSLEAMIERHIDVYARDNQEDTLNSALYSILQLKKELTLQMTFTHHIREPAGRVRVGTGTDMNPKHQKFWRTSSPAELAALVDARVACCDGPFFLILWRGTNFAPPDEIESRSTYGYFSVKDIEEELEEEPEGFVMQILTLTCPKQYENDDEKEAAEAAKQVVVWVKAATRDIVHKVRLLIGKVQG